MPKRGPRTKAYQYDILVDFISKHPGMIRGKITRSYTLHVREKLWKELAARLNANPCDPQKTAQKWAITWSDLKIDVKGKVSEIRKYQGNSDVSLEMLSPLYRKVAILIGAVSAEEIENSDKELSETDEVMLRAHEAGTSTSRDVTEPLMEVTNVSRQEISPVTSKSKAFPDRPHNDEPDVTQLNKMVEFLRSHPLMIREKFTPFFTAEMNENLWIELITILNYSDNGPEKSLLGWKKVWSDLKNTVKSKVIKPQQYKRKNGGDPPPEPLFPLYKKIADLIAEFPDEADSNGISTRKHPRIDSLEASASPIMFDDETVDDAAAESSTTSPFIQTLESALQNGADHRAYRKRAHCCQEVDDKHVQELVAAEERKAAALEKLSDVFLAANVIDERRAAAEEERNRILQEQTEMERIRNIIFQTIATHVSTVFPSHETQ